VCRDSQGTERREGEDRRERSLSTKIIDFVGRSLEFVFSLEQLREILEIVKLKERKVSLYENYIAYLNQVLSDIEENGS
jgi:hypothetical protein